VRAIVIAKEPRPGRVKTRLCPPCDPAEAARIAAAALADTLEAVARSVFDDRVLALDGAPGPWLPPGFRVVAQRGRGLDERLAAAFDDAGAPAVLVGMDTPQIDADLLSGAAEALAAPDADAVLGSALDGGWWAVGLRRPDRRAFLGVPMSTAGTWAAQRRRLGSLGLRVVDLPPLRDVDTFGDAVAVAGQAPGSRFARAVADAASRVAALGGVR